MTKQEFQEKFTELTDIPENRFHPLVWIGGEPEIGENVYIGGMSEIYAKGARVVIGDNCDIASFVSINCSDSHKRCIGLTDEVTKQDIIIENNVYIGTQSYIGGGVHIGHHSVVGAGTIVRSGEYPPYSLIVGNPAIVKPGYYENKGQGTVMSSWRRKGMLKDHLVIVFAMEHYNPLGLIRTLGRCGISPVYIAIKGRGVASSKSKYIEKVHYVDTIEEGYEVLLRDYSNMPIPPFVLTTDDDVQSILDVNYSKLKDKFIMYNAGVDGRVTEYMDKKRILEIAEKNGLKVLPTVVVDRGVIPENLEYPVITKAMSPTEANWKKNVFICESEADLKEAFRQIACPKVLVQKFVEKKNELCLDGFTIDKGKKSFIPMGTNYNYLIRGYYSPYMTAFNFKDKEILDGLNSMLAEIGFEGIFSIEFIIDQDDTCYFSEVNFRNSTWNYIATFIDMPIPLRRNTKIP